MAIGAPSSVVVPPSWTRPAKPAMRVRGLLAAASWRLAAAQAALDGPSVVCANYGQKSSDCVDEFCPSGARMGAAAGACLDNDNADPDCCAWAGQGSCRPGYGYTRSFPCDDVPRYTSCCVPEYTQWVAWGECVAGWTWIEDGCFRYFDDSKRYGENAEDACQARGARLASIHSAAQNDAVWNLNPSGIILIGFSDFNEEGTWVWDDASNASYTNWAKGRPETNGAQGRAFFYQGPKWHDCDDRTRCYAAAYICKISEPAGPGPPSGSHRRAPSTAGTIRPTSDFSPAWVAPASLRATSARKSSSDDGDDELEAASTAVYVVGGALVLLLAASSCLAYRLHKRLEARDAAAAAPRPAAPPGAAPRPRRPSAPLRGEPPGVELATVEGHTPRPPPPKPRPGSRVCCGAELKANFCPQCGKLGALVPLVPPDPPPAVSVAQREHVDCGDVAVPEGCDHVCLAYPGVAVHDDELRVLGVADRAGAVARPVPRGAPPAAVSRVSRWAPRRSLARITGGS